MNKFETKIKLRSGQFAALFQVMDSAEQYYFQRANSKGDLQVLAMDILYWRIISGIKSRLSILSIKYKDRLVTEINFRLNDLETICLTNAILPGLNNSYNDNLIAQIRDLVYRSTYQNVLSLYAPPTLSVSEPTIAVLPNAEIISISKATGWLEACASHNIFCELYAKCSTPTGIIAKAYENLEQALEDGTRKSPVYLNIEDIGLLQIDESQPVATKPKLMIKEN